VGLEHRPPRAVVAQPAHPPGRVVGQVAALDGVIEDPAQERQALLIDSLDSGRSGTLLASRCTSRASMRSAMRRLSFSSAVLTAVTRGMSKLDRRCSPTCGSRWLSSRQRTSLTVLVRHPSLLSSSQLEANARNVGSSSGVAAV
jgi:hypothetical protein